MTRRGWRTSWRTLGLGAALALAAGLAVLAQPAGNQTGGAGNGVSGPSSGPPSSETPAGVPVIQPPPETPPANVVTSAPVSNPTEEEGATNAAPARHAEAKPPPPPPPGPPKPVRSPAAIVQALDKVTAETMRFAAPIGKPVRYKNLVFTVKACESTGLGGASPNASAYLVVDNAPLPSDGVSPTPPKQVFKGWMFANSPGLNPLQSPIYDAWLIACMAAPPPA
jgi:hypothetical protein